MKTKIVIALLVIATLGGVFVWLRQNNKVTLLPSKQTTDVTTQEESVIRNFMAEPNLELSFIKTDLPFPNYFSVGKVTKVSGGENMEAVEGWTRQVNVYHQKELLGGHCSVYEYHIDLRSHSLVAVVIAGLKPNEIEEYKNKGITCATDSNNMPKITKAEAESIAVSSLSRGVKNFEQIKNQFIYSQGYNSESHSWFWEDKNYKLPEGLEGRPYSYPTIRISVNGNKEIQYWNMVSLFQN
jgi:hypothetical protein